VRDLVPRCHGPRLTSRGLIFFASLRVLAAHSRGSPDVPTRKQALENLEELQQKPVNTW